MENYTSLLDYSIIAVILLISAFQIFMICNLKRFNANSFMGISLISFSVGALIFMLYAPYCESLLSFLLALVSWSILVGFSGLVFFFGLLKAIFYINYFYKRDIIKTETKAIALIEDKYHRNFDLKEVLVYRKKEGFGCYWVLDVGTYIAVSSAGFVDDNWKCGEMELCQVGDIIALDENYKAKLVSQKGVLRLVPAWKFS